VGKDGIPALTDPVFVSTTSADAGYIADSDPVMGLVIGGEAKAYPHNIGWWHEIVNDVVGGHPVVVSLCPLTGTGMVFDGVDGERRITMGVSGWLFNNNLIMYDRRDDETLFPQITHRAVFGPGKGEDLDLLPVVETTWGFWKRLHPNTAVVSGQGHFYPIASYSGYPYNRYREPNSEPMFPISPGLDVNPLARLYNHKELTMGLRSSDAVKAYPFEEMDKEAVINDRLGIDEIVVVFHRDTQMAIPYHRRIIHDGNSITLTFDWAASGDSVFPFAMVDRQTRSVWNLMGEATEGELSGHKLRQFPSHNAFWFAWATFWQNTTVHSG
jgi:hypothetical protein